MHENEREKINSGNMSFSRFITAIYSLITVTILQLFRFSAQACKRVVAVVSRNQKRNWNKKTPIHLSTSQYSERSTIQPTLG